MTIKEIREHSGLSQGEFCKRYGIPKGTLCHWESGERKPPLYVLSLLVKVVKQDKKKNKNELLCRIFASVFDYVFVVYNCSDYYWICS